MRCFECICLVCERKIQISFPNAPYPEFGQDFTYMCLDCNQDTLHTRTATKKTLAELKRKQEEQELRQSIIDQCKQYGFSCRFLYQSVIITTPISDWCFDYHQARITLYHESTIKINFSTGNYAKAHCQFKNKKMSIAKVIDYIASHDAWRAKHQ